MGFVFRNVVEAMNTKKYDILVPMSYQPNLPIEMLRGERGMNYIPEYPDAPQRACYPISYMIDMADKRVCFTISNGDDIPDIMDIVDGYLEHIRIDIEERDPELTEYARKVLFFRENLYQKWHHVCYLDRALLHRYKPGGSSERNFFALRDRLSLKKTGTTDEDILWNMRFPPYEIPSLEDERELRQIQSNKKRKKTDDGMQLPDGDDDSHIVDSYYK